MTYYYVNKVALGTTKAGKPYKSLIIIGLDGPITANMFDRIETCPGSGTIAEMEVQLGDFNNIKFVGSSMPVREFELMYPEHPLLKAGFSEKYSLNDVLSLIKKFNRGRNGQLSDFLKSTDCVSILNEMVGFPAALKYHHVKNNGLISHTFEVCSLYEQLIKTSVLDIKYPLEGFVACLFHDWGKTIEYCDNPSWLVGHVTNSVLRLQPILRQHYLQEESIDVITHCMLAHHGRLDWGSPVTPSLPEAHIIHYCDMMSANCYKTN